MANRNGKLILRTLKNISAGISVDGGGQGGTGSNYLMTTMDYLQVVGKHIDVDSLIALFEQYGVDMDAQAKYALGVITKLNHGGGAPVYSICLGYDVCSGGVEVSVFSNSLEDLETSHTYRTILTANKEKIEAFVVTKDLIDNTVDTYSASSNIIINGVGDSDHIENYITVEEALSIFK